MVIIYNNPRCSKSREALTLLREAGVKLKIVNYLDAPLSAPEILRIMNILDAPFASLVRVKDEKYKELKFDLNSKESVAANLALYPELLERPIVVKAQRAVLGRPIENIHALLRE